jgi:hypothetical protein
VGVAKPPKHPAVLTPRGGPSKKGEDLRKLGETLGGGGGDPLGSSGRWLEFHEVIDRIVEEEEALLGAHMQAIQGNADMLSEEGALLKRVQGRDVVDYDIDAYATALDDILRRKLAATQDLLDRLATFRKHLAIEDELARRHEADAIPMPWAGHK